MVPNLIFPSTEDWTPSTVDPRGGGVHAFGTPSKPEEQNVTVTLKTGHRWQGRKTFDVVLQLACHVEYEKEDTNHNILPSYPWHEWSSLTACDMTWAVENIASEYSSELEKQFMFAWPASILISSTTEMWCRSFLPGMSGLDSRLASWHQMGQIWDFWR